MLGVTVMVSSITTSRQSSVGRPRDEHADRRICEAALLLYGDAGWSGFNFTKVASLAGVGKSTMYSRWSERDDLLLDAFRLLIPIPAPDGDTVPEILTNWAASRVVMYIGPHAKAIRRVFVEAATGEPVIRAVHAHLYKEPIAGLRKCLWEYKDSGVLKKTMSITRLLDAIEGSVLMRGFSINPDYIDCFFTEIPEYVEALVEDQLQLSAEGSHI